MYKSRMIIAVIMIICLMTACVQKPSSEERGGINVATESSEYQEGHSNDSQDNTTDPASNSFGDETSEGPNYSSDREISEILNTYAGTRIEQTIEVADGKSLFLNANINVDGITRVSQYEYVLTDITDELRESLFIATFPEMADRAEYDELNDVWTLDIDPAIRNYFLYLISYSNGGATIPGEQIIMLENRYYDLYPFEDNRLSSTSDSGIKPSLDEAEETCKQVVDAITSTGDYTVDFIHAYGNNGRRPYLKLVFKRMLDDMPVTAYNDLSFLFDNNGIEKVSGSLFSVKETGMDGNLISPEEAVEKLREQAAFLSFDEKSHITVTEITLEYVVVISPDGKTLVRPVWRFLLGGNEDERYFLRQKILGIDAVTGELIWEERGNTL